MRQRSFYFSKTVLYLLENYSSAEKVSRMNLAVNNSIFDIELNGLLILYKSVVKEIDIWISPLELDY